VSLFAPRKERAVVERWCGGRIVPIHDWTRVDAGIFHHFPVEWIGDLSRALNRGLLPPDYYALAEQLAGRIGPDVLSLQRQTNGGLAVDAPSGGVTRATSPPRAEFRLRAEPDHYAAKVRTVVIRHVSKHQIIAMIEIVSPGNKDSRHHLRAFVEKAVYALRAGIHLVIVDLFPPGPRDPQGIDKAIWDELIDNEFTLPPGRPLTLASYIGGPVPEAFVQPTAVGARIADMALFLTEEVYIPLPLETTCGSAFDAVPAFYRDTLTCSAS
jgi:Protein of unknown function (DUF4058)